MEKSQHGSLHGLKHTSPLARAYARFAKNDTLCLSVYFEYIGARNDFQQEIKETN